MKVQSHNKNKERGVSLVEYGLLIVLVALICIPAVRILGTNVSCQMKKSADGVSNVASPGCGH